VLGFPAALLVFLSLPSPVIVVVEFVDGDLERLSVPSAVHVVCAMEQASTGRLWEIELRYGGASGSGQALSA